MGVKIDIEEFKSCFHKDGTVNLKRYNKIEHRNALYQQITKIKDLKTYFSQQKGFSKSFIYLDGFKMVEVCAYCSVLDSKYDIDTNEWLEKKCKGKECSFCKDKPKAHPSNCKCVK